MRFTTIALALLASTIAAAPAAEAGSTGEYGLEDTQGVAASKAVKAKVRADGLRFRTCAKTSCKALGQFAKHTEVNLACFKTEDTTTVKGDK